MFSYQLSLAKFSVCLVSKSKKLAGKFAISGKFIHFKFLFFEKWSKIKDCCFQCQSIGNLITSSAVYGIPYSNIISSNDGQDS